MNLTKYKTPIFLSCEFVLFLLKAYSSGMSWIEIGLSTLLCVLLTFFILYFRKKIVGFINDVTSAITDDHSLLCIAVLALTILYAILLHGSNVLNIFLVCFASIVHIVNLHSHTSFYRGAVTSLFISLALQVLSILLYTTVITMVTVLIINYTASILLAKQYPYERNVDSNKIYLLLTYGTVSTLLLLHSYSLAHIFVEAIMVVEQDALGWETLLSARHPVGAVLLAIGITAAFFYNGRYQIKNRSSAIFILIYLWHLLFSQWNIGSTLLFTVFVCYLLLEKQYYTIEDLIEMDIVSEALEREILKEFSDSVKSAEDLELLQAYIFEHPTFYAWHLYLHLAWCFMDNENYQKVVRIAEICLGVNEFEILFPEPEFILPE